ncbi:3-deoxy-7-phosphoheptulonate synthase [Candidatus Gracilibacteria bacterium]|nr:3-deoxy-7-phosphoheptulonate synthase [Candidatus Gracilibacteria bacterium]
MSYEIQKVLPRVTFVRDKLPLKEELKQQVEQDRKEISDILAGRDNRKILIVGPCSAWPSEAILEYAEKLKPIADKVSDKLKIVMRAYIQKPRTTVGWVGPVNQPDPYAEPDIEKGIFYCREMMIKILELGYAIADEAVYTHKKGYFTDLYSYLAIGARSTEDQEHRIFASMVDNPVGMKNSTSGEIETGVNSIIAAQFSHVFVIDGQQIKTSGNSYAHLVLRGGGGKPNCNEKTLKAATEMLYKKQVKNPAILVDISHDNSLDLATGKKDPLLQPQVLEQVLVDMEQNKQLATTIKGFMCESYLQDGGQNLNSCNKASELEYGKSVTDGCLGFEKTEKMMLALAERL